MSKTAILSRLRAANAQLSATCSAPSLSALSSQLSALSPTTFPDPLEAFVRASEQQGCRVAHLTPGEAVSEAVKRLFPKAKNIASAMPGVPGNLDADSLTPRLLQHTDLAVAQGAFGVAENGCVYIPQTVRDRSLLFLCDTLLVVLSAADIVSNMHEAYARVPSCPSPYSFGCFIAGPSKTADIAQVLVVGAQAARACTILIKN